MEIWSIEISEENRTSIFLFGSVLHESYVTSIDIRLSEIKQDRFDKE